MTMYSVILNLKTIYIIYTAVLHYVLFYSIYSTEVSEMKRASSTTVLSYTALFIFET